MKIKPNPAAEAKFLTVSPAGSIPMIEEGVTKVHGGNHLIYVYICKTNANLGSMVLPPELEEKCKAMIGWH